MIFLNIKSKVSYIGSSKIQHCCVYCRVEEYSGGVVEGGWGPVFLVWLRWFFRSLEFLALVYSKKGAIYTSHGFSCKTHQQTLECISAAKRICGMQFGLWYKKKIITMFILLLIFFFFLTGATWNCQDGNALGSASTLE